MGICSKLVLVLVSDHVILEGEHMNTEKIHVQKLTQRGGQQWRGKGQLIILVG